MNKEQTMTDAERAIALMENLIGCMYGDNILPENKDTSAYVAEIAKSIIIPALREQQAREKGCDCCGLIYKLDGESYGTDSVIIENRFCPMCGKRLEVEHE